MGINLVHTSEIEKFFLQQAEGDLQLASWLQRGLLRSISRREKNAVELREMPDDAPDWLRRKWPEGGPFHRFQPDAELVSQVRHIVDWLSCARQEHAPFLQRRDAEGVPFKIHNISLESAFNAANKYFGRAHSRAAPLHARIKSTTEPGVTPAMELAQGRRFVEITAPTALVAEGRRLRHCAANYAFRLLTGSIAFYSLRDADNRPKATISINPDGTLDQCKGRCDGQADKSDLPEIAAFLDSKKVKIPRIHRDLPGYFQLEGGGILPFNALPAGYSFSDGLHLRDCHLTAELPARLVVQGAAFIERCSVLKRIGEGFTVQSGLYVTDCHALESLSEDMRVGYQMRIESSGLFRLPAGLVVNGDIVLNDCRRLVTLGSARVAQNVYVTDCENLVLEPLTAVAGWLSLGARKRPLHVTGGVTVEGNLAVQDCAMDVTMGDNLHVTGDLYLKDCPRLASLPRNLRVGGDLTLINCGITELPEGLKVGGGLKIDNCPQLEQVAGKVLAIPRSLHVTDCPALRRLPPIMPVGVDLYLFRCTGLGPVLPSQLSQCPNIRTDLFLTDRDALY